MKIFIRLPKKIALLGFVCSLATAPAAAQTASGTMVPVTTVSSPAKPAKHEDKLPKSEEFTTISAAAAHCPHSTVVWSSLSRAHCFHLSGSRYFGKTKHGAYVCEDDAAAAGFHQAKS